MVEKRVRLIRRSEPGRVLLRMPDGTEYGMSDEQASAYATAIRVLWLDEYERRLRRGRGKPELPLP
jgi:hypothetical protein